MHVDLVSCGFGGGPSEGLIMDAFMTESTRRARVDELEEKERKKRKERKKNLPGWAQPTEPKRREGRD